MEYPGRCLLIQAEDGKDVVVYGITGRSPSSQARKLVTDNSRVFVQPTDEEELKRGNPDLLVYNAIRWDAGSMTASNGKHTDAIHNAICWSLKPIHQRIDETLLQWEYEPDAPNYTPRIWAAIAQTHVYLGTIIRGPDGNAHRTQYEINTGQGFGITTYQGPNVPSGNPLPSYREAPFPIKLEGNAPAIAQDVWDCLDKRFRVSVAVAIRYHHTKEIETNIVNKHA